MGEVEATPAHTISTQLDAIYCIVHQTYEPDRVHRLINELKQKLPTFPHDRISLCAPTWGKDLTVEQCFKVYNPWLPRPGWPCFTWKNRCMIQGEISLVLNFYHAMRDALEKGYKTVLILESDVFLRPDFEERLGVIFDALATREWDYVSLSDGIGTHAPCFTGSYMKQTISDPPHSFIFRCTDSMLFRTEIFKKLVTTLLPFRECLDWELNYQFLLHGGKGYWAEPHIVEQGSTKRRDVSLLPA